MKKLININSTLWANAAFRGLSVTEKLIFIYLSTNSRVKKIGAYEISVEQISSETGIDQAIVIVSITKINMVKMANIHISLMVSFTSVLVYLRG